MLPSQPSAEPHDTILTGIHDIASRHLESRIGDRRLTRLDQKDLNIFEKHCTEAVASLDGAAKVVSANPACLPGDLDIDLVRRAFSAEQDGQSGDAFPSGEADFDLLVPTAADCRNHPAFGEVDIFNRCIWNLHVLLERNLNGFEKRVQKLAVAFGKRDEEMVG